jgi:hypothetical protein
MMSCYASSGRASERRPLPSSLSRARPNPHSATPSPELASKGFTSNHGHESGGRTA